MLKLFNTLTRKVEEFVPLNSPKVGMYTCGPTVYREIHIGNLRTYLAADFLRRVLEYDGYTVTHIKNITDVGHMRHMEESEEQFDPIIKAALDEGKTPLEISQFYTKQFLSDEKKLNILPATKFPKATEHVDSMIQIIKALLKKGFAYESEGNIYFDVKKFKNYGQLSGNTLDKMDNLLKAVRVSLETDKKDSADFVLWKRAEKDRLMKWDSPWGEGYPGWHIECSVMSQKYLGESFDIHTGGEDLIFPHHEDEIAQSEAATGKKFVKYWVHGGYLLVDGNKMSRSKRNVYVLSDLQKRGFEPLSFRYLCATVHYRQKMNFTWEALEGAQKALERLSVEVSTWDKPKIGCAEYEEKFLDAINNDLNMPEALAVVHELIKSDYPSHAKAESLFKFDQVLGLKLSEVSSFAKASEGQAKIPDEIIRMIKERDELRKKKRFHLADQLRNKIIKMGYEVHDDNGSTVVKKR